jgi:hypothetical protein
METEKSWRMLKLVCSGFFEQTPGLFRCLGIIFGVCTMSVSIFNEQAQAKLRDFLSLKDLEYDHKPAWNCRAYRASAHGHIRFLLYQKRNALVHIPKLMIWRGKSNA